MDRILIGGRCEVMIGPGAAAGDVLPARPGRERVAVLTQPGAAAIARSVARRLGDVATFVRVLPDADDAKSLAVVGEAYDWLAECGVHRGDTILAVGGGALSDVAGFVAATYLRGIEVVYVATTMLAAVDAAIGGKTGINRGGKNLVGVFRHPARVVVDTDVLEALPAPIYREGLAEALKAGLVGDPALVDLLERHGSDAPVDEVVRRAVAVKAAIVDEDFTEGGRRAVLNYGHTLGHAVEVAAGLSHGHAVAVGMVAAGRAAELATGFTAAGRQRDLIARLGLPTAVPGIDLAAVRSLIALDKKRDHAGLRMVLLRAVGDAVVTHIDPATVEAALAAIGGAGDHR